MALPLLWASGAQAQTGASQKAAAEALFDQGLALLEDGEYEAACQKLEQSQAIDRGLGTMLYLADCYEKLGRTASAWALFREASSIAAAEGQQERAAAGRQRAEALEPRLSTLTIVVPEEQRVEGLTVTRSGSEVMPAVWGVAVPVDPGRHRIEVTAPGHRPWTQTVVVGEDGATSRVTLPPLLQVEPEEVADVSDSGQDEEAAAPAVAAPPPVEGWSTRRVVAVSVGGVGAAALLAGMAVGGVAMAKNNDAEDDCRNGCTGEGVRLSEDARTFANASTALWAVGGTMLATGLVFYFVEPDPERPQVSAFFGPRAAGMSLRGEF